MPTKSLAEMTDAELDAAIPKPLSAMTDAELEAAHPSPPPVAKETRIHPLIDALRHPLTSIPGAQKLTALVTGPQPQEHLNTLGMPSWEDVGNRARKFIGESVPTSPVDIGATLAAGPIARSVVGGAAKLGRSVVSMFPEEKAAVAAATAASEANMKAALVAKTTAEKAAADAAKKAADTALNKTALDKATGMVQSKAISREAVDNAYKEVYMSGNPQIDARPIVDRIDNLMEKQLGLEPVDRDKAFMAVLKQNRKAITDNEGTLSLRELQARVEDYGAKGYGSDTVKAGRYRALQGAVHDTLDAAETEGKGIAPSALDSYRAARTLDRQRRGGIELREILDKVSKEKSGEIVLKRDTMIDQIRSSEQIKRSFKPADREDMIKLLRDIQLPTKTMPVMPQPVIAAAPQQQGMSPGMKDALHVAGRAVLGVSTVGISEATALLLSTATGRQTLRSLSNAANGAVIPANSIISAATAMLSGQVRHAPPTQ